VQIPGHSLPTFEGLIYSSPQMKEIYDYSRKLADTLVPILLYGERGCGRKSLALAMHNLTANKNRPFIIFTHHPKDKGSSATKKGVKWIIKNHPGTLYMEEIGNLSAIDQFDLYFFLKESESNAQNKTLSTRIIAGTQKNLQNLIEEGKFRNDLYYSFIALEIPPLRSREADILTLSEYFIRRYSDQNNINTPEISEEAHFALAHHTWPGNIAELESRIKRAILIARETKIMPADLGLLQLAGENAEKEKEKVSVNDRMIHLSIPINTPWEVIEKQIIEKTLTYFRGDKDLASKSLGISARTIYRKLGEMGRINPEVKAQVNNRNQSIMQDL